MKFYKSLIICLVFVFCSPIRSADLPEFNGKCLYTLEEGLNKIYEIANNRNLSLKINWIDDDIDNHSADCEGKIVGSNLNEGSSLINQEEIVLVVARKLNKNSDMKNENPESTNDLPSILSLNLDKSEYPNLKFTKSENGDYDFLINPSNLNPFSALIKVVGEDGFSIVEKVEARFPNNIFEYNFNIIENAIFVEVFYLESNSNFDLVFKDNKENEIFTKKITLPEIKFNKEFKTSVNNVSDSWMYISGANDGYVLILDEYSNIRAYLEIPKDYTRVPSRAGNQFYNDHIVFFNDKDYKYYSMDFYGNINLWFDNDLNFQYEWHHDTSPSKTNNTYLVHVNDLNQKPFAEDVLLEIDINKNSLIRVIDLKNILDFNLPVIRDAFYEVNEGPENESKFDWFHGNSVEYVSDRDEIIISGRHLGLIGLDYESLKINWFLPHNPEYYIDLADYPLLLPTFDNFIPPNGQHNLTYIDGKLVYFDNQSIPLKVNGNKNYNPYDLLSYFVVLDIDFQNLQIINQELFSHENFWSKIRGGVDYIDSSFENILISYGGIYYDEFGARTLSRQTNPKKRSWSVVEYENDKLIRIIEGDKGFGAYRSMFFNPNS